jgi:large conductance mechanosensitive channel
VGNMDFKDMFFNLEPNVAVQTLEEARKQGVAVIGYGAFITTIIDFLIVAICIFAVIKAMNTLKELQKKKEVAAEPTAKDCPQCCSSINIKAKRCPHCTAQLS